MKRKQTSPGTPLTKEKFKNEIRVNSPKNDEQNDRLSKYEIAKIIRLQKSTGKKKSQTKLSLINPSTIENDLSESLISINTVILEEQIKTDRNNSEIPTNSVDSNESSSQMIVDKTESTEKIIEELIKKMSYLQEKINERYLLYKEQLDNSYKCALNDLNHLFSDNIQIYNEYLHNLNLQMEYYLDILNNNYIECKNKLFEDYNKKLELVEWMPNSPSNKNANYENAFKIDKYSNGGNFYHNTSLH